MVGFGSIHEYIPFIERTPTMEKTKIFYHMDNEKDPYMATLNISPGSVTLADFKNVLIRPNYKYFFRSMDDEFGVVKEEIADDDALLPCRNGRVVSWLISAEGGNVSDGASQCTDSMAHSEAKHGRVDQATSGHGSPLLPPLHTAEHIRQAITKALEAAPENKLQVKDIYVYCKKYYKIKDERWKIRVRQELSTNKLFSKIGKGPGRGWYWTIHKLPRSKQPRDTEEISCSDPDARRSSRDSNKENSSKKIKFRQLNQNANKQIDKPSTSHETTIIHRFPVQFPELHSLEIS